MKETMFVSILLAIVIAIGIVGCTPIFGMQYIPKCAEDAVLIGMGDFDNSRYTRYVCGPAMDDFQE